MTKLLRRPRMPGTVYPYKGHSLEYCLVSGRNSYWRIRDPEGKDIGHRLTKAACKRFVNEQLKD